MKKIITVLFITALILTAVPFMSPDSDMNAYAASTKTKKGTVYTHIIKHGNTVYCMVHDYMIYYKIYKVDLKRGKAKLLKKNLYNPTGMKYKKGYIYVAAECGTAVDSYNGELFRINVKTGKKTRLEKHLKGNPVPEFVVSKNTIYFTEYKYDYDRGKDVKKTRKMKLNGKSKKNAGNVKVKVKAKKSNTKGYKIKYVESEENSVDKYYLVKPNGSKIYLGKQTEY